MTDAYRASFQLFPRMPRHAARSENARYQGVIRQGRRVVWICKDHHWTETQARECAQDQLRKGLDRILVELGIEEVDGVQHHD